MTNNVTRGKINKITLKSPISFNGYKITKAIIEIDHINYGLNKSTKRLNTKRRTHFSNRDIEKFIRLLDGEDLALERYEKRSSIFMHFIKCPVKGNFEGREFVMVFKTEYDHIDEIHTITLFLNW